MTGETHLARLEKMVDDLLGDRLPKALAIQDMMVMLRQACASRPIDGNSAVSGDMVQTILHYLTLVQRTSFRRETRVRRWLDRFRDDKAGIIRASSLPLALADFDFSGLILSGIDFGRGTVFRRCTFDGTNLSRTAYADSTFLDCTFHRSVLRDATFVHARFERCRFDGADLYNTRLGGCAFEDCSLRQTFLVRTSMSGATVRGCDFAAADLSDAVSVNATYYACSFEEITTSRASKPTSLQRSRFEGCSFRRANLGRTDFRYATLRGCTTDEAKLDGAKGI